MSKRQRFVITSIILSLGFIGLQFLPETYRYVTIGGLGLATVLMFAWSLREGLGFNLTLLSLVLPFLFTVGVGLFWFLLPANIFARIPVVIVYGLGVYALCLTSNIYTVSAIRTIALLRAARGVGFVLTLATSFLLFDTILSLRANVFVNALLVFLVSFLMFIQGLWSIWLNEKPDKKLMLMSLVSSIVMLQVAIGLYFWPVTIIVGSLFLTVYMYILLGLFQIKLEERLFVQTVREYLTVGTLVFIGMFFATHWR